jgi:hypothetical protein
MQDLWNLSPEDFQAADLAYWEERRLREPRDVRLGPDNWAVWLDSADFAERWVAIDPESPNSVPGPRVDVDVRWTGPGWYCAYTAKTPYPVVWWPLEPTGQWTQRYPWWRPSAASMEGALDVLSGATAALGPDLSEVSRKALRSTLDLFRRQLSEIEDRLGTDHPRLSISRYDGAWILSEPSGCWVVPDLDWVAGGTTQIRREGAPEEWILSFYMWRPFLDHPPSVVLQITSPARSEVRNLVLRGGRGALGELLALGTVGLEAEESP